MSVFFFNLCSMKTITKNDIDLAVALFVWISPKMETSPQLWTSALDNRMHCLYKYEKNNRIHAIWMDIDTLNEVQMKRIWKKINTIPHEFFMYHHNNITRIGWRIKK